MHNPEVAYIGWIRYGWCQWRPEVSSLDYHHCWFLLTHVFTENIDGERLVLPAGEFPDRVPTPRAP